jgi:hypothetical protein
MGKLHHTIFEAVESAAWGTGGTVFHNSSPRMKSSLQIAYIELLRVRCPSSQTPLRAPAAAKLGDCSLDFENELY